MNWINSLNACSIESTENARRQLICTQKELKKEIEWWRKDLGEETKQKINLEKKPEKLEK